MLALVAAACTGDDTPPDTEPSEAPGTTDDGGDEDGGDAADGTTPPDFDGEGLTLGLVRAPTGLFDLLGAAQGLNGVLPLP